MNILIFDEMSYKDKIISFSLGLVPKLLQSKYMKLKKFDLNNKSAASSIVGVNLASGIACFEIANIILKRRKIYAVPNYFQFDAQLMRIKRGKLIFGNRGPIQRFKHWFVGKYMFS